MVVNCIILQFNIEGLFDDYGLNMEPCGLIVWLEIVCEFVNGGYNGFGEGVGEVD